MPDENSRAMPVGFYRDPAEVVEMRQMKELGCRACASHLMAWGKVHCSDPRKENNKGVPHIGQRCKYFELRK